VPTTPMYKQIKLNIKYICSKAQKNALLALKKVLCLLLK